MPAGVVTDMIARGPQTGLPVLAVTTSAQVAGELADLTNVLVVHRMTDTEVARRLAAAAVDPALLRDGEFVLAVKDPPRLVPRAVAVPARIRRERL
jgi:hypothetical protein